MEKEFLSVKNVMDTIVPITRFNRGEASKIFDEVNENGFKVVLKNNAPVCVLVNPERYQTMVDALEDYVLYFEAERRIVDAEKNGFLTEKQVMDALGVDDPDLEDIEVDID